MHILIAEDTPFLQLSNRELMNRWGYDFDMASNGREAVDYALKNAGKYDLGLMDIEMPEMNGLEATRLIRQKVKYFPIMAYTANRGYRRQCLENGFDAFVEKPVRDIKRARDFYEGMLGLKPTLETLGGMLVEYGFGNGTFTIGCLGGCMEAVIRRPICCI